MQWVESGAFLETEETFGRALAGEEGAVALVDVRRDQPGALGVGAGDEERRNAADVRRQPRRVEVADMRCGGDQHLAAQMAAFLLGRELILEMDAGGARLDIGLHDLEAVQGPAEAGFGIGDDRREPVALRSTFHMLDLVGALQRAVDPAAQFGPGIGRIERLIRIHRARRVGIGGDLPARQIDGVESGADHLHRLVAGDGSQRPHRLVAAEHRPQPLGAAAGEAVLDRHRAAQAEHLGGRIGPRNAVETARRGGNDAIEVGHGPAPKLNKLRAKEHRNGRRSAPKGVAESRYDLRLL